MRELSNDKTDGSLMQTIKKKRPYCKLKRRRIFRYNCKKINNNWIWGLFIPQTYASIIIYYLLWFIFQFFVIHIVTVVFCMFSNCHLKSRILLIKLRSILQLLTSSYSTNIIQPKNLMKQLCIYIFKMATISTKPLYCVEIFLSVHPFQCVYQAEQKSC